MSDESRAHRAYKQRLLESRETVLTELFGVGWPGAHRVIWNEATERWLRRDRRGPAWVRMVHRASAPLLARAPETLQGRLAGGQRVGIPLFSPSPPTDRSPSRFLDVAPLYAGETVARIGDILPAAEITHALERAREIVAELETAVLAIRLAPMSATVVVTPPQLGTREAPLGQHQEAGVPLLQALPGS